MKQAMAPRAPLDELWRWAERRIDCDIAVFTEAKVPKDGPPDGWTAISSPDGIGPHQRWGTVIAGRNMELRPLTEIKIGPSTHTLKSRWPALLQVADVLVRGKRWATVVGLYGITRDRNNERCFNGSYSVPVLLRTIRPLLESPRGRRVIVAGDFNLWPRDMPATVETLGLTDLIEWTRDERPPLERCANCQDARDCGHLWTHKNPRGPNAQVQQLDFILATNALRKELQQIYGGIGSFPDAWEVSDHAPVVAEFV